MDFYYKGSERHLKVKVTSLIRDGLFKLSVSGILFLMISL
jgi:hypothetical protein